MTKKRFLGIIMMGIAIVVGAYAGVWLLFVKSIMNAFYAYNAMTIVVNVLKAGIVFPMLISIVLPFFEFGRMIFLDK